MTRVSQKKRKNYVLDTVEIPGLLILLRGIEMKCSILMTKVSKGLKQYLGLAVFLGYL